MREHFDFYGYTSPTAGKYYLAGVEYFYGEDFRSVKRYKEYKDVGFNILLLQHENSYSGEDFETSACNKCMTNGYAAGLDRIIVSDSRLKDLCEEKVLVGENGKFKTEEEFLQYLDDCTKPYRDRPGFFGVQLFDEPPYWMFESYGKVYRGLKKILPNIFLQCNLLNYINPTLLCKDTSDRRKALTWYFNEFLDKSGTDYLMTDEYPFHKDYRISEFSLPVYQVMAEVCKARGVEFRMVLQSTSSAHFILNKEGTIEGGVNYRRLLEKDMYWQMNLAMGFGCREYSYYTYFTKVRFNVRPDDLYLDGVDGSAFITRDGSRTKLYYYTKRIIKEVKAFESVLLKYTYDNSYLFFEEGKGAQDFNQTSMAIMDGGKCPIDVKVSEGVVLVTRQCSASGCLYMVENIGNLKDTFAEDYQKMRAKISLGKDVKDVKFYKKGKEISRKLKEGDFTERLDVGEAIFIEVNE